MSRFDGSRGPPNIEGMSSLKVDNLTYRTTMDDLDRYFSKYGELGDIYIPRDRHRRESRGFAFVRYYEKRDAEDAIDGLDGTVIDGRQIRVTLAKYDRPTENMAPRGGRRPYGSSGGGRYDRSPPRRSYRDGRSDRRERHGRRSYSRSRSRSRSYSRRSRSRSPKYSPKYSPRSPRSPRRRSLSPKRSSFTRHSRSKSRSPYHSKSRSPRGRS